jgi:hypothetical protein
MISESFLWKDELAKISFSLKKKMSQKKWSSKSFIYFEKDIYMSFYIIRKLFDSNMLSTIYEEFELDCLIIPNSGKLVTRVNNSRIEDLFDFAKTKESKITLKFLYNQIIHSYVFTPTFDEEFHLYAFFVSSDKQRNKFLYCITVKNVIDILNILSKDYPNVASQRFDENIKDYKTIQIMSESDDEAKEFLDLLDKNKKEYFYSRTGLKTVLHWYEKRRKNVNKNV